MKHEDRGFMLVLVMIVSFTIAGLNAADFIMEGIIAKDLAKETTDYTKALIKSSQIIDGIGFGFSLLTGCAAFIRLYQGMSAHRSCCNP